MVKARPSIFGMVERGGRVRARVVANRDMATLRPILDEHVSKNAILYTDEWALYVNVGREFAAHHRIKHQDGLYAQGHVHTQTIEGFFGSVKRGLSGVQHHVSAKWLQIYVDEFSFKYNHRDDGIPMFRLLMGRVRQSSVSPASAS